MTTRPAKIAICILLVSIIGFICIGLFPAPKEWIWLTYILEHAFEGAMVGGLCDFLAVSQVYKKAEENYVSLTEGVSRTVVREMLQIDDLMRSSENIDAWLADPEHLISIQKQLQQAIPEDDELKELVENIWIEHIHEPLCTWLVKSNPQKLLHNTQEGEKIGMLDMPEVRRSLALCMQHVAEDEQLAERSIHNLRDVAGQFTLVDLGLPSQKDDINELARTIWSRWKEASGAGAVQNFLADKVIRVLVPAVAQSIDTLTIHDILGPTLSKENLQVALNVGAKRIAQPSEEEIPDQLMEAVLNYFDAYLEAWMLLTDAQKRKAVEELVVRVQPKMTSLLYEVVLELRDEFLKLQSLKEQVWIENIVSYLTDSLHKKSTDFGDKAEALVTERLQELGPKEFRMRLQRRTQEPLDWIKVNGTGFGFVIGGLAGGVSLLLHQL